MTVRASTECKAYHTHVFVNTVPFSFGLKTGNFRLHHLAISPKTPSSPYSLFPIAKQPFFTAFPSASLSLSSPPPPWPLYETVLRFLAGIANCRVGARADGALNGFEIKPYPPEVAEVGCWSPVDWAAGSLRSMLTRSPNRSKRAE